jgi:hypothetical protein
VTESTPHDDGTRRRSSGDELATDAERARTPHTPVLAFASVWVVIATVVAVVIAVVFVVSFAWG